MIQRAEALSILSSGFQSIQNRKGGLTIQDVEAEVINQACKCLLERYSSQIESVHDIHMIGSVIDKNQSFGEAANTFAMAASELLPSNYGAQERMAATQAIIQNISWAGMWDFLRGYFSKTHGQSIDSVEEDAIVFYSRKHERYERGVLVSQSEVQRVVHVNWMKEKSELVVSIEPSLSAKKGFIKENKGNVLIYRGADPDYEFELTLDVYDGVEGFKLRMPNRGLELIYF